MQFEQRQWLILLLIIVIDLLVVVLSVLALVPMWEEPDPNLLVPNLNLLMSPLVVLSIVLLPTVLLLRWGWPEELDQKALLLPLRLGLAYEFLHGGIEKLIDATYLSSPGLIGFGASSSPSQWVRDVMTAMLSNYQFFLLLIAVGELLIGLSMLTGGFTRLGALGGVVMQWTFLFLLGWLSISTFGINFVGSLAFLVIGMYQAGRFIGLDQIIGPRMEGSGNRLLKAFAKLT